MNEIIWLSEKDRQIILEREVKRMADLLAEIIPTVSVDKKEVETMKDIQQNLRLLSVVTEDHMKVYVPIGTKFFYNKWKKTLDLSNKQRYEKDSTS